MLHAPTSETRTETTQSKTQPVPQPKRELHPYVSRPTGLYSLGGMNGLIPGSSSTAQRRPALAEMQSAHGNQAVLRMMHSPQQAMRMTPLRPSQGMMLQRTCACGGSSEVGGECAECKAKEERMLQRRAANAHASPGTAQGVPPIVHEVLRSPGQPLDAGTRAFMEPRFGHDFGGVRVHTDARAAESARAVNALAYTVGRDVVFGTRQYAPETSEGRRLIAHELTHVVQQQNAGAFPQTQLQMSHPSETAERESDQIAEQILRADPVSMPPQSISAQGHRVMRDFDSTMLICHRLLNSRTFHVDNGVVTATLQGVWAPADTKTESLVPPECSTVPYYHITLMRKGLVFDSEISTHPVPFGHRTTRTWTGLASGDYYLTIWTNNTNPNCCLEGDISVSTPTASGESAAVPTLPTTACYDGDILYVSKGGRSYSCPALTGTVGDPTPPGLYCIRRQGEAIISGGVKGRVLQDRQSWFLLEPQFSTNRFKMVLHPGTMSSGCITVMDRTCFDQLAGVLNSGETARATGYDGYPPGNSSGTETPAHDVDCVGFLTVTSTFGNCARNP